MKPADLLSLLQGLHADKLALRRRHEAGARRVPGYEHNNTYQYVINRENEHLSWLSAAILEYGATPAEPGADLPVPETGKGAAAGPGVFDDDVRAARAFLEKWATRTAAVTHARHRKMLDLMMGETREQLRFFELAAAGSHDLLGRRPAGAGTGGGVMPARWIE